MTATLFFDASFALCIFDPLFKPLRWGPDLKKIHTLSCCGPVSIQRGPGTGRNKILDHVWKLTEVLTDQHIPTAFHRFHPLRFVADRETRNAQPERLFL